MESRYYEPLYDEDPDITSYIFQPRNNKMYGKQPRYNEVHPRPLVLFLYRGSTVAILISVLVETGQFIEAKASGQSFEPVKSQE